MQHASIPNDSPYTKDTWHQHGYPVLQDIKVPESPVEFIIAANAEDFVFQRIMTLLPDSEQSSIRREIARCLRPRVFFEPLFAAMQDALPAGVFLPEVWLCGRLRLMRTPVHDASVLRTSPDRSPD